VNRSSNKSGFASVDESDKVTTKALSIIVMTTLNGNKTAI
jgi:hypothetical protein